MLSRWVSSTCLLFYVVSHKWSVCCAILFFWSVLFSFLLARFSLRLFQLPDLYVPRYDFFLWCCWASWICGWKSFPLGILFVQFLFKCFSFLSPAILEVTTTNMLDHQMCSTGLWHILLFSLSFSLDPWAMDQKNCLHETGPWCQKRLGTTSQDDLL